MSHIQLEIQASESIQELIICKLSDVDYDGFEQFDDKLIAYIDADKFDENELILLLNEYDVSYCKSIMEKQNWNQVWESNFDPVIVDDFVGIRAQFHPPVKGVQYEIVITPKMSFGTGHHATTFMVMRLMSALDFSGKDVIDFGTGTGVLAILANHLGAATVLAIDNDDWCIENSRENILNNKSECIDIQKIDSLNINAKFDIILANINRNILLDNLQGFIQISKPGSQFLMSGLLETDEAYMIAAFESIGLAHIKTIEKSGWIALLLQR